ncbi:MAG: zeta toxin family protein [Deltaproteobacteria bacterium]|nr:zeta toxin family protein [Deltaproteobacteria bacterium]
MSFAVQNSDSSSLGEISSSEKARIRELYLASAYPVTGRSPRLFATAGNIAAGKTSLLRFLSAAGQLPAAHAVRHDPDAVMSEISAYRSDTLTQPAAAFRRWEIPARLLADEILVAAVERRCDVVYDRTCALPDTLEMLRELKQREHYEITMYFVWASVEECLERSKRRERTSRRHVPAEVISERAESLRKLFPAYVELADEVFVYENFDGSGPRHIGSLRGTTRSEVHDLEAFTRFVDEYKLAL